MTSTFVANRNELEEAFKTLRKFLKRRTDIEVVLTFDNGRLSIDANGITVRASGTGSLHGQAYVNWRSLVGLATIMPEGDAVLIKVEASQLIIGTTMIRCIWQESIIKLIEYPMDAPVLMTLQLKDKYTDEEIVRSGLLEKVWEAERQMDEMIVQSATILRPLGIEIGDVRTLVEVAIHGDKKE
ncbi:MAG: hypothetical protein AABO57_07920 [Acidobacteriota bacterium]